MKFDKIVVASHNQGKIKEIKAECTPGIFNGAAKRVVTQKPHGRKEQTASVVGESIGKQSPDLSLQD